MRKKVLGTCMKNAFKDGEKIAKIIEHCAKQAWKMN